MTSMSSTLSSSHPYWIKPLLRGLCHILVATFKKGPSTGIYQVFLLCVVRLIVLAARLLNAITDRIYKRHHSGKNSYQVILYLPKNY